MKKVKIMLLIASIAALTAFCGCGEQKETGAKGSSAAQQTEASQEARKESTQAESSGQQESAGQESSAVRESSASQQESTDEEELFDKDLYVIDRWGFSAEITYVNLYSELNPEQFSTDDMPVTFTITKDNVTCTSKYPRTLEFFLEYSTIEPTGFQFQQNLISKKGQEIEKVVIVLDEEGQTTLDAYSGSGTVLYHYSDVQ